MSGRGYVVTLWLRRVPTRHRIPRRSCSGTTPPREPPAPKKDDGAITEAPPSPSAVAATERPTDLLYSRKEERFFKAVETEVAERRERMLEKIEDPEFRSRLGVLPDKYTLMRGTDKAANIEQQVFLKDTKLLPGLLMMAAVLFAGVIIVGWQIRERNRYGSTGVMERREGTAYIGSPKIGGDFVLTNATRGGTFNSEDYRGKWLYIYFGFTHCPDICPDEMKKLSKVTDHLRGIIGDLFQPVFITVDPKRDNPEAVREYLEDFHPAIFGLTGSVDEVNKVTRKFRVFHAVPDIDTFTDQDYLVDHSIITYLISPDGKFADFITKEYSAKEASLKVRKAITTWESEMVKKGAVDSPSTPITKNPNLPVVGSYSAL